MVISPHITFTLDSAGLRSVLQNTQHKYKSSPNNKATMDADAESPNAAFCVLWTLLRWIIKDFKDTNAII